jgi:disulfide bond formation protein DsbB
LAPSTGENEEMSFFFRPRVWFLLVFLCCAGLLGFAFYVQYKLFEDPCPLCILQRIAFIWIGLVALAAVIHNPGRTGRFVYATLLIVGGAAGIAVSGRHLWLQNLPPDQVPECGMGLNYMLETMPFGEVLSQVFHGSGECAQIGWTFAGLSMPWWTLFWYIGLSVITLLVVSRRSDH